MYDWAKRLNECGERLQSKNYCNNNNTTAWVWECVLVKVVTDFADWAFAKPPFKYTMGFGYDGIGFIEEGEGGKWIRCTRHEDFTPVKQSDFQFVDPFRENQWSRAEITIGPQGVIRSVINGSTDWISLLDEHDRGIICFYDDLWVTLFPKYWIDKKNWDLVDIGFECILQPTQMSRFDYIEHLINRQKCGSKCYEQTVIDLPCISQSCYFKSADDYGDDEEITVTDGSGNKKIIKGKEAKLRDDPDAPSCIDVCVVSGGGLSKNCIKCIDFTKTLNNLSEQNKKLTEENQKLQGGISKLVSEVTKLKKENRDLISQLADYQKLQQSDILTLFTKFACRQMHIIYNRLANYTKINVDWYPLFQSLEKKLIWVDHEQDHDISFELTKWFNANNDNVKKITVLNNFYCLMSFFHAAEKFEFETLYVTLMNPYSDAVGFQHRNYAKLFQNKWSTEAFTVSVDTVNKYDPNQFSSLQQKNNSKASSSQESEISEPMVNNPTTPPPEEVHEEAESGQLPRSTSGLLDGDSGDSAQPPPSDSGSNQESHSMDTDSGHIPSSQNE